MTVDELLKQKDATIKALEAVNAKLKTLLAQDTLTDDQRKEHDGLKVERTRLKAKVADLDVEIAEANATEQLKAAAEISKAQATQEANRRADDLVRGQRRSEPDSPGGTSAETGNLTAVRGASIAENWGFRTFSEFAHEVYNCRQFQTHPTRILNAYKQAANMAATGMGEAIGSDGGFLVPTEFSRRVFERVYAAGSLLSRTDIYNISGNTITFPRIDETSRATGSRSGGVQAYWRGEGGTATATKPKLGRFTLTLNKLIAMGVATDELMEDSSEALDQFLYRHFSNEIDFLVSDSLVNGTGAGQPIGILNADCTVSVSKETGQSAATLNATNILKMWSRMFAGCRMNSVWLINQDVEPQLYSMQIGTGVANQVVYMPPGGLSQNPYATLMGRPVVPVEYCATLGTVGDIILVDLSQWATAVKSGGPKQAVSMHLYFDRDEQAFRVTYRLDSRPWWASALTPYKGSNTQSCAVTLATRA